MCLLPIQTAGHKQPRSPVPGPVSKPRPRQKCRQRELLQSSRQSFSRCPPKRKLLYRAIRSNIKPPKPIAEYKLAILNPNEMIIIHSRNLVLNGNGYQGLWFDTRVLISAPAKRLKIARMARQLISDLIHIHRWRPILRGQPMVHNSTNQVFHNGLFPLAAHCRRATSKMQPASFP